MKTYKNLYPHICTFENLLNAFYQARRGKPKTPELCAFEYALEPNLFALRDELRAQTYRPGPYHNFYIHEPKKRKVSAAPFRDRVVHHALCNVIAPIFESRFIYDSYANRVGKGTHRALTRAQTFLRQNDYCFHGDILKCFPSIDHQILLEILGRRIADAAVMKLIRLILQSGEGILADEYEMQWFAGDDVFAPLRPRGLPIGNLTSQFWANIYLGELDTFVKHELRCPYYLRYVDDFLIFSDDKRELHHARQEIAHFLERLRLRLHPRKQRVFPVRTGVDFLGFVSFPERRKIRRENVKRFTQRLRRLQKAYTAGEISLVLAERSMHSWLAHAGHADSYRLRSKILAGVVWTAPSIG
ncbi:MAG: RNA-dependent DNA polymerase [Chloroflexi bacterium]|nr:RNA-dependent DNA polymerase [Chloroflexota bacterium]